MIGLIHSAAAYLYWPLPLALWPLPFALPFWAIYLWTRSGERKVLLRKAPQEYDHEDHAQAENAPQEDRDSWALIDYGSKAARLCALIAACITPPWLEGAQRMQLYGTGLLLMVAGSLLRRYCFRLLGRHFTFRVAVPDTHAIIEAGIYRHVRHPSYTGGLLYNAGLGLALTNKASVLFLAAGMAIAYAYRVHVEEKALLRKHGAHYREYMQRTKRFIPFFF